MKCPVMSFEMVSGFAVILGSLYIEAHDYIPVLLENLRGMSCSGTCLALGWCLVSV